MGQPSDGSLSPSDPEERRPQVEAEAARRAIFAGGGHESLFRLVAESIEDYAIFVLDRDGYVVTWAKGAARLKGYAAEEILGRHFACFYSPEDRAVGKPDEDLRLASSTSVGHEEECWRLRRDGSRFWALCTLAALRNGDGEVIGFAKITRDIDAHRRAEIEQHEYAAGLVRSNRDLESLASVASHDLQEPLRKIRAFTERVMSGWPLADEARDYLRRSTDAAIRMQQLIDALLSYARIGGRREERRRMNLNETVREVMADLDTLVSRTGGRIEAAPLPEVQASPTQMRQLLQNLIGNGLKFRREGVPPVVRLTGRRLEDPPRVEIAVEDNGIGFEEKYATRIFGVFQRLHRQTEFPGTGIGLAICQRVVEQHGGTLIATSIPGTGSRFLVTLPSPAPEIEAP